VDARVASTANESKDDAQAELGAFSWWLAADSLPLDWRLEQFNRLLTAGFVLTPDFLVFPVLRTAVRDAPATAVDLLKRFLELSGDIWTISGYANEIEEILRTALHSGETVATAKAEETIQWLGTFGLRQFRQLLSTQQG
jgi:hypothetical protein